MDKYLNNNPYIKKDWHLSIKKQAALFFHLHMNEMEDRVISRYNDSNLQQEFDFIFLEREKFFQN